MSYSFAWSGFGWAERSQGGVAVESRDVRTVWDDWSDEELLGRSHHEAGAFGVFYARHEERLLGYFLRRVGDAEVAADNPGRRLPSTGCAGDRLLRRELDDDPARIVGGGGRPTSMFGFARAGVARIAVLDPRYPTRVVLSEPWSPEPWRGEPIRFFQVLSDAPHDKARDFLVRDRLHLVARLASGELVDVIP
jgi:hypothetical protein